MEKYFSWIAECFSNNSEHYTTRHNQLYNKGIIKKEILVKLE